MSSPHDPYRLGYTRVTKVVHKERRSRKSERISKSHLISDCPLQLEGMKVESLVIVDQHATVKQYLSFVLPARHALKGGPVVKSWLYVCVKLCFILFGIEIIRAICMIVRQCLTRDYKC